MAGNQAFDDEELAISLSSSQIRRNRQQGNSQQSDLNENAQNQQQHRQQQQQQSYQDRGLPQTPPLSSGSLDASAMSSSTGPPAARGDDDHQQRHAASRDKSRAEQRIGAYKIVKTLGEGSFGKVKLAVHRSTGQKVALKIISRKNLISRDMQGRVEREIEYLQLLRHPHIIKL
jgi:carbon catabolite-derepressing protein kinase